MHPSRKSLIVELAPNVDLQALQQMCEAEREHCPFLIFSFDEQRHRLEVAVDEHYLTLAIEAIADQLTPETLSPPSLVPSAELMVDLLASRAASPDSSRR